MNFDTYSQWKEWAPEHFGVCDRGLRVYLDSEFRKCNVSALAGKRVLEIGFGNGALARWATDHGALYRGVEVDRELVRRGREAGFDVFMSDEGLNTVVAPESLDVVVAIDVLEHLSRSALLDMLKELAALLAVGGRLIARVPSGDSPFARHVQHGDITHEVTIGSSMVRQLATAVGLVVEQIREPAFPIAGSGARSIVRRTCVQVVRWIARPVISNAFMNGGRPVLAPDMMFVLRKQRHA